MRLGDLDALKEEFEKVYPLSVNEMGVVVNKRIYDIIDNAPTVEESLYGEWIPVSEKLPKQGNRSYLVTVDYGKGLVCSTQRFFFNEEIGWNDDSVIAWQPSPEPYKKGGAK